MRLTALLLMLLCTPGHGYAATHHSSLSDDETNIQCLQKVYTKEITGYEKDDEGIWLLVNGKRVAYKRKNGTFNETELAVDVSTSMKQPYALEPNRPKTKPGYAPGRKRSYELFKALYGSSPEDVRKRLVRITEFGQTWLFSPQAAKAFQSAVRRLEYSVKKNPKLREWLVNDGTFYWRKIAGEKVLSAHSFGIAFDIGVKKGATYWRWFKKNSHPLQNNYPKEIVSAFEDAGFIWGGKWYEFDLMHFEYRPELICKAKNQKKKTDTEKITIIRKIKNFLVEIFHHKYFNK